MKKQQIVLVTKNGMDQINDFKKVDMVAIFEELMESYCEAVSCGDVSLNKYEKTLKKIGAWVDEARANYGIK